MFKKLLILILFILVGLGILVSGINLNKGGDMEVTDKNTNLGTVANITIETYLPPNNMTFHNNNGEVGRLEWDKEGMTFTGKADESAKIFFNDFLKGYVDNYIKELLKGEGK